MSDEHFTVDGTLLEACAGLKSFKRMDGEEAVPPDDPGNPTVDFSRSDAHQSDASIDDGPGCHADQESAGKEAKLSYSGHVLMENRNGLVADVEVLQANGTAERDAALVMIEKVPGDQPVTVGADKAYDTKDFVKETRNMNTTPHVAHNNFGRASALTAGRHGMLVTRSANREAIPGGRRGWRRSSASGWKKSSAA
jgi:hypothetical protein